MTKKEQESFDNFRKHCQKEERAIMIGNDFVAMDKKSYEERITKEMSIVLLVQTFNDILEIYWEQPDAESTADLKKMILNRYQDLLQKKIKTHIMELCKD